MPAAGMREGNEGKGGSVERDEFRDLAVSDEAELARIKTEVMASNYYNEDLAPTGPEERTWTCSCGTEYRVTGEGRHQVHWPAGAPDAEPVMDGRCVRCGQGLPGERIAA